MSDDIGSGINTNGSLTIGQSVQSDLGAYYDSDWFKVTLDAGKAYMFTVNGAGQGGGNLYYMSDVELDVMDSTGRFLDGAVVFNDSDTLQLSFVAGQSGTYFVNVASQFQNVLGSYTLQSALQTQAPDDYAPNASTSGVLTAGTPLQAKFETAGDIDWFKFHADAGHVYNLSFGKDAGLVPATDFLFYDANGVVQPGYPFEASATGDYYVSLRGGNAGSYAVTLNQLVDDYTGGDSAPGQLAVGGTLSGAIQFSGDSDRFQVHMEAGKIYTFELSADSSVLPNLLLTASYGGNSVTLTNLGEDNGVRKVIMVAAQDGVYALNVREDYHWNGTTVPYTLTSLPAVTDDVGDTVAKATIVTVDSSFTGRLDTPSDTDMFRLDATMGVSYVLSLDSVTANGSDGQLNLNARSASGDWLNTLMQTGGQSYTFTPTSTGPFYFEVDNGYTKMPSYTFSIHKATDDFTANPATAGQLSLDQPATGKIDFQGDRDWFGMSLDAGTTYWFTLKTGQSDDPTAARLGTGTISVMDASGKALATINSLYDGFSTLSFAPASKGTYYVQVQGANSTDGVGLYQLQAQVGVRDDYGNDAAHAATLTPGVTKSGVMEVRGDVDVFKLSATAGINYGLSLQATGFAGAIKVTDASGHDVGLRNNYNYGGNSLFQATSTGDYYVTVYASYGLIDKSPYKLSATAYAADDVGDNASTTATLAANGRAQGSIDFPDDQDWFKVHLDAGRSYSFDLLGSLGGGGSLSTDNSHARITLYDNNSRDLASTYYSNSIGEPHMNYIASTSGDYYLAVEGNNSAIGSYTLAATVTSTDLTPPVLVSSTPSTGLGLNSNIVLNFSELITLAPNPNITLIDDNGRSYSFTYSKPLVAGQSLIIDPSVTLQPGMNYTLHIGAGNVLDMAGNKATLPPNFTFSTIPTVTTGTSGNDYLLGSGTGQYLEGGDGIDSVYYGDIAYNLTISHSGDTYTVRKFGAVAGDTLHGIERLIFTDHAIALDIDGNGGQVYRLYQAAFNRTPDQDGLGFWIAAMDNGMSLQTVAHGFAMSPEFQAMYGSAPTDAQYVNQLYQNVLHRAGDASGTSFWLDALQHGHSRDEVLAFFSESPENQAALIGKIGNGFDYIPHV